MRSSDTEDTEDGDRRPPRIAPQIWQQLILEFNLPWLLSPKDAVAEQTDWAQLQQLASGPVPRKPLIDWYEGFQEGSAGAMERGGAASALGGPGPVDSDETEELVQVLRQLHTAAGGREDAIARLSPQDFASLVHFLQTPTPTPKAAASHPVLRDIPKIHTTVAKLHRQRKEAWYRAAHEKSTCPTVLWTQLPMGTDLCVTDRLAAQFPNMELWITLSHDPIGEDLGTPALLRLTAVLLNVPEQDAAAGAPEPEGQVLAAMAGYYVMSYCNFEYLGEGGLLSLMDAHSNYLNDAWKAVFGDFRKTFDYDSLEHMADELRLESVGLMVPRFYIPPEHRAKGLTTVLLAACAHLTEKASLYSYTNTENVRRPPQERVTPIEWTTDIGDDLVDIEVSPIALYVVAVEGTPSPEGEHPFNLLERNSLQKSVAGRPRDPDIEKARQRLVQHLQRCAARARRHLVCYDPWDYPVT